MAISRIAPSDGDFTSLLAWVASLPGVLTEPEIAACEFFPGGENGGCVITGISSTQLNFILITATLKDRHKGFPDGTKFYLFVAGRPFDIRVPFAEIQYVQILDNAPSAEFITFSNGDNFKFHHNITDGQNKDTSRGVVFAGGNAECYRNIFFGKSDTSFPAIKVSSGGFAAKIYNNTVFDNAIGIETERNDTVAINNAAMDCGQAFKGLFDQVNSGYNAITEASGAPGANNLYNRVSVDEFINITPGNEDLRLLETATLRESGFDLGPPYNIGIQGNKIFDLWDIGADEFRPHAVSDAVFNIRPENRTVSIKEDRDFSPQEDRNFNIPKRK